jgi:hypothetical protein
MVKSKEHFFNKTLETKTEMMERKSQEKQAKWELLREDEKRKAAAEERRASVDEKRTMVELIAEENKTMMMDTSTIWMHTQENGGSSRGWRSCRRRCHGDIVWTCR